MPIFLFLIYPFLEILAFSNLIEYWGWGNTILWVLGSGFLGTTIMASTGRSAIVDLQTRDGHGLPSTKVAHKALIFVGGFLIFLPGLLTDAIGIIFVLPGVRHLLILVAKTFLVKRLSQAAVRIFSMGKGGGGFVYKTYSSGPMRPQERDVNVVEVKPIEVTHQNVIDIEIEDKSSKS